MLTGVLTATGLGFVYFIAAIPAGVAAGASPWAAGVAAWIGYSAGAAVVAFGGKPLRDWLAARRKRPAKTPAWIERVWNRFGVVGLGLLAPVTVGPQAAAFLAIACGTGALRTTVAISLGALPWCAGFVWMVLTARQVV